MLLSPEQVAKRLGVHRAWVLRRVNDGTLEHIRLSERVIRIDSDDVDRLIEASLRKALKRRKRGAMA